MLNNCIYIENTLNLWLYLLFLLVLTWSVFQQWCRMNDLVLVLVVNSEQILHTVLVYCWCPLSITIARLFLEEYHFLNEWNIITTNTKKRICCCSYSKKTELISQLSSTNRSSRPEVFCKKGVLGNFAKFIGKHLSQSLFINKVAGLRPATLLKKEALRQVFSYEFCEISKNTFFYRTPLVAASVQKPYLRKHS